MTLFNTKKQKYLHISQNTEHECKELSFKASIITNCWNIVTSKNILYVSFVVPDGPTGRTTCIIFYPDASNRKN